MITNGPDISVIEGTEVTVTCKSYRGKPAATITWIDKDGKEIEKDEKKENIEDSSEEVDATKLHNAASTVKLKLGKEEHNKNLTCQTTHEAYCSGEADSCPVSTTILMLVKYAPELTITQVTAGSLHSVTVFQEPVQSSDGGDIKLTCTADANPPEVLFKWYIDDIQTFDGVAASEDARSSALDLTGMSKASNGKVVKCAGTNNILNKAYTEDTSYTLDVHCKISHDIGLPYNPMIMSSCHLVILSSCCPFIHSSCPPVIILTCPPEDAPSWLVEPTDTSAGAGDKVTLECQADGNPSPSYIWYRGEQGEQVGGQLYS